VSLVSRDEQKLLRDIERLIRSELKREIVAGFEPGTRPDTEPEERRPPPRRNPRAASNRSGDGRNSDGASRGGAARQGQRRSGNGNGRAGAPRRRSGGMQD